MAEEVDVSDEIGAFIWTIGIQVVFLTFSWPAAEVVVEDDSFVVGHYEVAACEGKLDDW